MSVAEDEPSSAKLACENLDLNESFSSIDKTLTQTAPKDHPKTTSSSLKKKPNAHPKKVTISEAQP